MYCKYVNGVDTEPEQGGTVEECTVLSIALNPGTGDTVIFCVSNLTSESCVSKGAQQLGAHI